MPTVCENALNDDGGILINVSRAIIYPEGSDNFSDKVSEAAFNYQRQMSKYL